MTNHSSADTDESTANGDTASADADAAPLDKDLVFEILKNQRRRRVLQYIREDGHSDLGNLAEQIAAEENDTTVDELSADERKRVYIGLYQTHLPKMDEAGVVIYDQSNGVVSAGPAIVQLIPYLETAADDEDADADAPVDRSVDLSAITSPIEIPAVALFAVVLVAGLLAVAATSLPGPTWAVVLAAIAGVATFLVQWT